MCPELLRSGVTLLDQRTPHDVLKYFVDLGNQHNNLSSNTSFLQLYARIPAIEETWKRVRKDRPKDPSDLSSRIWLAALPTALSGYHPCLSHPRG